MANVKVSFPEKALENQIKLIKKQLQSRQLLDIIAKDLIAGMRKGINPGTGKKFKKLEDSTIANRKRLAKFNKTHKNYSSARSNLTFTGQFLDSIKATVEKSKNGVTMLIEPTGVHTGYNTPTGGRTDPIPNEAIAIAQKDLGRSVFSISKVKLRKISLVIIQFLRKKLA